ncbi:UNVERIFIED_CONTAM: hypothetical protein HDU68_002643 [Siphonaria sp. JEL0065]|nr:hypothetical protein HDU68_002643 [Siphonaria sp. JEL0065]
MDAHQLIDLMKISAIPLIPALYQSAGWLFPTLIFIIVGWLSGMACLFLIESMTYFPGNRYFERNVEFTVLVHHFYGKKWYYLMHIILYGSLQSFNISSIISAVQSFDTFVLSVFGQTCGFRIYPAQDIVCMTAETASTSGSPFGTDYMLITAGGLMFGCFIAPLMQLNLDDNMIVQWISLAYIAFVVFCWVVMMFIAGVNTSLMPTIGLKFSTAPTAVIGQVMFNFTFANTIPSWINTKHKKVSIHKCIWVAIVFAAGLYVITGIAGALAFEMPSGSNLMSVQTVYFNEYGTSSMQGLVNFITLTFPILCLITSIPVAMIIIRLNLIMSRLCSKDTAGFFGSVFPFLICIPFQTGPFMVTFTNWSSLFFQSMCNFMAPFLIYIFLDQRNTVMAQSVIDELENLDLDGAIRKKSTDEDDFDYVYHLPHADLSRLPPRKYDPFAQFAIQATGNEGKQMNLQKKQDIPKIATSTGGSMTSVQGKAAAKLLSLGAESTPDPRTKRMHNHHKSSKERLTAGSKMGSQAFLGSQMNLGSRRASSVGQSRIGGDSMLGSLTKRKSNASGRQVSPFDESTETFDFTKQSQQTLLIDGLSYFGSSAGTSANHLEDDMESGPPSFKTLPDWITKYISSRTMAIICFTIITSMTLAVLAYDFVMLGFGIDVVDS